jgi:hypothetical protein
VSSRVPGADPAAIDPILGRLASADRAEQAAAYDELTALIHEGDVEVDEAMLARLASVASTPTHPCSAALGLMCELIWLVDDLRMFTRFVDGGGGVAWERAASRRVREVLRARGEALAEGDEDDRKVVAYAIGMSFDRVKEPRGLLARLADDPAPGVRDTAHIARAARAALDGEGAPLPSEPRLASLVADAFVRRTLTEDALLSLVSPYDGLWLGPSYPDRAEVWGTVLSCMVRRCEDPRTRVEWASQLVDMASHTIRPDLLEELEDARRGERGEPSGEARGQRR